MPNQTGNGWRGCLASATTGERQRRTLGPTHPLERQPGAPLRVARPTQTIFSKLEQLSADFRAERGAPKNPALLLVPPPVTHSMHSSRRCHVTFARHHLARDSRPGPPYSRSGGPLAVSFWSILPSPPQVRGPTPLNSRAAVAGTAPHRGAPHRAIVGRGRSHRSAARPLGPLAGPAHSLPRRPARAMPEIARQRMARFVWPARRWPTP